MEDGAGEDADDSDCRAVMRVFTTQIGLVMRTVADPATAPASMDSTVVRVLVARPARRAARVKKALVHSYPRKKCQWERSGCRLCWRLIALPRTNQAPSRSRTVVVDKVRDSNAKQCTVQPRVQSLDAFSLNNPTDGIIRGGIGSSRFDLSSCGECDERISACIPRIVSIFHHAVGN